MEKDEIIRLTTDLVCAYAQKNGMSIDELPELIELVYAQLDRLAHSPAEQVATKLIPAIPIEESITEDFLICLEDGKAFKSLKRHLRSKFDLTPEAYRKKWGLPPDYPMVAPAYAKQRSKLAKKMGLGRNEG